MLRFFLYIPPSSKRIVSQLEVAIVLTILTWLGLQAAVVYGKHVVEGEDIVRSILSFARENDDDMIIIGAAEEGILRQVLFGEIPERVGEAFDGQVIMVKKHRPVRSTISNLLQKWIGKGARSNLRSRLPYPTRFLRK